MKCIEKDGVIQRVGNDRAYDLVKSGWEYTSKSKYKPQNKTGKKEGGKTPPSKNKE